MTVASFYTVVLGFTMVDDDRHNGYLSIRRDQVRIGAAYRPGPHDRASRRPVTDVEIVVEVDDLDAEYAGMTAAEWPIDEDLVDRPWGLRDFRILDPNGYYYRITGVRCPEVLSRRSTRGLAPLATQVLLPPSVCPAMEAALSQLLKRVQHRCLLAKEHLLDPG